MYKEIEKQGLFVKNPDGTPFVTQFWDGLGSYIDFTNPKGCDFWKKQVTEKLLDYGIDATWNDNNEFDIRDWDALANGFGFGKIKARNIRPNLTYLMVKSSYEAQRAKYPDKRPFLSTRSGNIAVRRLAQTWSGDNMTSWHDLYYGHYVGLTLSMSGMFFYGHDLGGFSGDMPSSELLLRWIQHGIFEPRFTIHSWNKDGTATMPWSYPEIENAVRDIFSQRKQLLPYLYSSAYNCVSYDEPMNAPLFLYYEDEDIEEDSASFKYRLFDLYDAVERFDRVNSGQGEDGESEQIVSDCITRGVYDAMLTGASALKNIFGADFDLRSGGVDIVEWGKANQIR